MQIFDIVLKPVEMVVVWISTVQVAGVPLIGIIIGLIITGILLNIMRG